MTDLFRLDRVADHGERLVEWAAYGRCVWRQGEKSRAKGGTLDAAMGGKVRVIR